MVFTVSILALFVVGIWFIWTLTTSADVYKKLDVAMFILIFMVIINIILYILRKQEG